MHTPNITCKNCGHHFHGRFCNECGEKVYGPKDKSMMHIIEEVFHFISHFDGSFLTTVKTVFARPGKMSADYAAGIRKKYFKPVSFFLFVVVMYFIFPKFHGLNMHFQSYVSRDGNTRGYSVPIAKQKMISHRYTENALAERYDSLSPAIAKMGLLLLIPFSALVIALLYFSSRRFFFDHFILATEIMSFYILFNFVLFPLISSLIEKADPGLGYLFTEETAQGYFLVVILSIIIFASFVIAAFRNFYKQPLWLTLIKAAVFIFVFSVPIRYVYNLILYLLVMLFV